MSQSRAPPGTPARLPQRRSPIEDGRIVEGLLAEYSACYWWICCPIRQSPFIEIGKSGRLPTSERMVVSGLVMRFITLQTGLPSAAKRGIARYRWWWLGGGWVVALDGPRA